MTYHNGPPPGGWTEADRVPVGQRRLVADASCGHDERTRPDQERAAAMARWQAARARLEAAREVADVATADLREASEEYQRAAQHLIYKEVTP